MDILPPKVQNLVKTGRAGWANVPRPGSIGSVTVPAEAGSVLVERATGCIIVTDDRTPIKRTEKVVFQRALRIDRDDYRMLVPDFEGYITHMYLDCKGLVTVGLGHQIPDVGAALVMRFRKRKEGNKKSIEDAIRGDYFRVLNSGMKCKDHELFEPITTVDLNPTEIEHLFDSDFDAFVEQLSGLSGPFPDFATYPESAQLGMLDLAYNTGAHGFYTGFPVLVEALRYRNWIEVAEQSHREEEVEGKINDTIVQRNEVVRRLFLDAIKSEPFFVNPKCPPKRLSMFPG